MLKEAIDRIVGLASDAAAIKSIKVDRHTTQHFDGHGNLVTTTSDPHPVVSHAVGTLESMAQLLTWYQGNSTGVMPVVYFDPRDNQVTLVLDHSGHRINGIGLGLTPSKQWKVCSEMPKRLKQKQMLSFLRQSFSELVMLELLAKLRKIEFVRRSQAEAAIGKQKETLGRAVEASVQAVDELPEEIEVFIPHYVNTDFDDPVKVLLLLEVDLDEECFVLSTAPNSLSRAAQQSAYDIQMRLREALPGVAIIIGCPEVDSPLMHDDDE